MKSFEPKVKQYTEATATLDDDLAKKMGLKETAAEVDKFVQV